MESLQEKIHFSYKEYKRLYNSFMKQFKEKVEDLPFFKELEVGSIYKIIQNTGYCTIKEKVIYGRYLGVEYHGALKDIAKISYKPLKKDLTEYQGRRGHSQYLFIEDIVNIEKIK